MIMHILYFMSGMPFYRLQNLNIFPGLHENTSDLCLVILVQ